MVLTTLGRLSQGKQRHHSLLRAQSISPLPAGRNPAVSDPCESDQRSDQATALQSAAPGRPMVLRIHPAPPHIGNRRASSTNSSGYSSHHQMETWMDSSPPATVQWGEANSSWAEGRVHRWLKSRKDDPPPFPILALTIVRVILYSF